MNKTKPDFELRQEEIRDLLGIIPPRIVRWGTAIIGVVLVLLVVGAAWFHYPDRIRGAVTLSTMNPPVVIKARTDGRLLLLSVNDKDSVKPGQLLGILESSARYENILRLDTLMSAVTGDSLWVGDPSDSLFSMVLTGLGECQDPYSSFRLSLREYLAFKRQGTHQAQSAQLHKQLKDYQVLYERQYRLRQISSEALAIKEHNLKRMEQLRDSGTMAETEYESALADFLKAQAELENCRTRLSEIRIGMDVLEFDILSNDKEFQSLNDQKINTVMKSVQVLAGAVDQWKLNYAFVSPVSGTIALTRVWTRDQQLVKGDRLLTILKEKQGDIVGRMLVPLKGAGKVRAGQDVMVRLDNYPYMQYGFLKGRVSNLSALAERDYYIAELVFPMQMKTTYSKVLDFSEEMTGQAEIITEEMSFLVRIIHPIRSLLSRNRS